MNKAAVVFWGLTLIAVIANPGKANAGAKVAMGAEVVLKKVADLPDTDDYSTYERGDSSRKIHLDLGCLYQTYNICWLPVSISQKPILVGLVAGDNEHYYPLPDSFVNACIKANNLDREKLTELGFFTRHGGKIAMLPVIALMVYGIIPSREKKTKQADIRRRQS